MVAVWSKRARAGLLKAYKYIYKDSPQNAVKVRDEIIDVTINLSKHPEFYPPDKFKKDNDGRWRAFELHKYRISYLITKQKYELYAYGIQVVRLRTISEISRLHEVSNFVLYMFFRHSVLQNDNAFKMIFKQ